MIFFLIVLIYTVGIRIGTYRIFEKCGIPGWKAFVPVICSNEWQKLVGKPTWWTAWLFVPGVNLFYWAGQLTRMSTAHCRDSFLDHMAAVLFAPIYWPWLGFNDNIKYISTTGLKPGQKPVQKTIIREWADALIFALAAAYLLRMFVFEAYTIPTPSMEKTLLVGDFLFVSKFHYGARVPQTPLAIPLMHHTIWGTNTQSYSELIKLPYMKLPALQKVKRYDMVVFNFPAGDTVALNRQEVTYYDMLRDAKYELEQAGDHTTDPREAVNQKFGPIKARPVDKRENYIKRCVAVAGDKLEIKKGILYINDQIAYEPENRYLPYIVTFDPTVSITEEKLYEFNAEAMNRMDGVPNTWILRLTQEALVKFKTFSWVKSVEPFYYNDKMPMYHPWNIFPNDINRYHWDIDNFGPVTIPQKGMKLNLNDSTICQYKRLIEIYEGNKLEQKGGKIYINGTETSEYTCKMDYYWMMGDNRHNSADSRFWGFVPEDHIVGKAWFIWFSWDARGEGLFQKIRWSRLLTNIHNKWAPKD